MSIKDKDLETEIHNLVNKLEKLIDCIGPTPLRRKMSNLIVDLRINLISFDQEDYEKSNNIIKDTVKTEKFKDSQIFKYGAMLIEVGEFLTNSESQISGIPKLEKKFDIEIMMAITRKINTEGEDINVEK